MNLNKYPDYFSYLKCSERLSKLESFILSNDIRLAGFYATEENPHAPELKEGWYHYKVVLTHNGREAVLYDSTQHSKEKLDLVRFMRSLGTDGFGLKVYRESNWWYYYFGEEVSEEEVKAVINFVSQRDISLKRLLGAELYEKLLKTEREINQQDMKANKHFNKKRNLQNGF